MGIASANTTHELLWRKGMPHSITYPTPGERHPALPREGAASLVWSQEEVGRADAPPQGDLCA